MPRLTLMVMLVALLCLACGDGDSEPDSLLDSDAALGSLDEAQKIEYCTELVAVSPAACWQAENWFRLRADETPDAVAACAGQMAMFAPDATLAEMSACYTGIEGDECVFPSLDCGALIPQNNNELCTEEYRTACKTIMNCDFRDCGDLCDCEIIDQEV